MAGSLYAQPRTVKCQHCGETVQLQDVGPDDLVCVVVLKPHQLYEPLGVDKALQQLREDIFAARAVKYGA